MLFGVILTIHIIVCFLLIGVILLQSGRGGLSEALGGAAAQSLFGGGAATVLTRATAIAAGIFVVTCLSLAGLSTARGRSVIEQVPGLADILPTSPDAAAPGAPASPDIWLDTPQVTEPAALPEPIESPAEPTSQLIVEPGAPAEPAAEADTSP